jgi:hypothetical protein
MERGSFRTYFNRLSRTAVFWVLLCLLLVCIISLLTVSINRTVDTLGRILPAREWVLARTNDGGVYATYCDHLRSSVESYAVLSIVRGDAFQLTFDRSLQPDSSVLEGDTLVHVFSHELMRQFHRLSGELAVSRSNLAVMLSGEKAPVIAEAERALVLAKEESELQTALFERQDSLYRKNLVSREIYELARSSARVASLNASIADARLQTVMTGVKPEQVDMVRSQIMAFEGELRVLARQVGALTVLAPFGGRISSSSGEDTLCVLEDTAKVVDLAIPIQYHERLKQGLPVTLWCPHWPAPIDATVVRVDTHVHIVNARQFLMVTAQLHGSTAILPSNLIVSGSVETDRVSLARYLQFWISDLVREILASPT